MSFVFRGSVPFHQFNSVGQRVRFKGNPALPQPTEMDVEPKLRQLRQEMTIVRGVAETEKENSHWLVACVPAPCGAGLVHSHEHGPSEIVASGHVRV